MFFILSKILEFAITPICWVFVLLIIALLVKRQPLKKRLLITTIIVFYFFSNKFIINEIMVRWEIPAMEDTAIHGKYDVAIVLGGMTNYDSRMHRVQFEHGGDRLFQALKLYKQGIVNKLLLDGGSGSLDKSDIEAPILRDYLLQIGIPDSVILIEPNSRNTHENALFAKPILDSAARNGRYLMVTSGYHMRRALGCFNKVGIHTMPYSTDRAGGPFRFQFDYWLVPNVEAMQEWSPLIHEALGYLIYKIIGYI